MVTWSLFTLTGILLFSLGKRSARDVGAKRAKQPHALWFNRKGCVHAGTLVSPFQEGLSQGLCYLVPPPGSPSLKPCRAGGYLSFWSQDTCTSSEKPAWLDQPIQVASLLL